MGNISDEERSFAVVLKSCRHAAGLTQKDVAEASGLSTSYIALIEAGERNPPRQQTVERLARACNVNEAFLVRIAKHGGTGLPPILRRGTDDCLGQEADYDINSVNGKMLHALIEILSKNAPELSYAQIFQKLAGLSLWWRFFTICHHENLTRTEILNSGEKLLIQEKLAELEHLDSWLLPSKFPASYERDVLSDTNSTADDTSVEKGRSIKDFEESGAAYLEAMKKLTKLRSPK